MTIETIGALFAVPETPKALSGIVTGAGALYDPVSARQHRLLQRARDDEGTMRKGKAL